MMKEAMGWGIIVCLVFILGCLSGYLIQDSHTIEDSIISHMGEPLSDYPHQIRQVIYEVDLNGDGKYDATMKWNSE